LVIPLKKDEDILAFLLELNLNLAQQEENGEEIIGPGLPPGVTNINDFITEDCISLPNQ
jgi:hypothetical protein